MSSSTTYTVFINDEATESRSKKSKAVELAEQALARNDKDAVEVRTGAGTVVWPAPEASEVVAPEAEATASNRTKPGTRTEVPTFEIEAPEGYEAAYTRPRVLAVVFRHETEKGDYLVIQVDGEGTVIKTEAASNTTEARVITNRLADEHRKAVAEAKEKADAEKQAAKDKKAADKQAALEAKEAAAAAADAEVPAELEAELQDA